MARYTTRTRTEAMTNKTLAGTNTIAGAVITNALVTKTSDSAGVNRWLPNATAKAITDAGTDLFDVALAANSWCAGVVFYSIVNTDGTDFQALTGTVTYAAVSKATVQTLTVTNTTAPEAKAASSGTLTTVWAGTAGTGKITVKVTPTGSLTETTFNVVYTVVPLRGAVTIL